MAKASVVRPLSRLPLLVVQASGLQELPGRSRGIDTPAGEFCRPWFAEYSNYVELDEGLAFIKDHAQFRQAIAYTSLRPVTTPLGICEVSHAMEEGLAEHSAAHD